MSSIYLPEALKKRLIQAAKRRGFSVHRGSQSQLPDYISHLLELDEQTSRAPTLHRAKSLLKDFDLTQFDDEHVQRMLDKRRMNL